MKLTILYFAVQFLTSCSYPAEKATSGKNTNVTFNDTLMTTSDSLLTFLSLGDSYTIGESVDERDRWPVQLVSVLRDRLEKNKIADPQIIAKTGWTTDELQIAINNANPEPPYGLVSLLIGVNNQYRGYPIEQYRKEFEALMHQAIAFAGNDSSRVFVVSIPDYGVTPFAGGRDKQKIAVEIDQYNSIAKSYAEQYGVKYFDITPISREAESSPELVAEDRLHPSAKMYSRWVDLIAPWVIQILDE